MEEYDLPIRTAVTILGEFDLLSSDRKPSVGPGLPFVWCGVNEPDLYLHYIVVTECSPVALARLAALLATPVAVRTTVVFAADEVPAPFVSQVAALDGVFTCAADRLLDPLAHLTGVAPGIGIDAADFFQVVRQRLGRSSEGPVSNLIAILAASKWHGAQVAFAADMSLTSLDAAMQPVREAYEERDLIWCMNTMVAGKDRFNALTMSAATPSGPHLLSRNIAAYRHHAAQERYCEPFTPFVGDLYGSVGMPRLLYCGAAIGCSSTEQSTEGDGDFIARNDAEWSAFALSGGNGSPFWRFLDAALAALDNQPERHPFNRRRHACWTNLSKLGVPNESAPPDSDHELRELDRDQMAFELASLQPDLVLCVSGEMLTSTGNAVFANVVPADFHTSVPSTLVRRFPEGGWLYWTKHPQRAARWTDTMVDDIAEIGRRIRSGDGRKT